MYGSRTWVHSIFQCNFSKCGPLLAKNFTHNHTSIWNNGSEFGNDMIYIYEFLKHDTSWSSSDYIFRHSLFLHGTTALWAKYNTVHSFGMDNPNLLNCLLLVRNSIPLLDMFISLHQNRALLQIVRTAERTSLFCLGLSHWKHFWLVRAHCRKRYIHVSV